MPKLRIATRNSPLALWQAHYVESRLRSIHADLQVEIVGMTTSGDQLLDRKLNYEGGKGLFLKELELSLLAGETDIAVHSMKDVPVELPEGLELSVVCERADPRDAFVSNNFATLESLPENSIVGTSSLRRVSLLRHRYPNLQFKELRGNVNTRLKKLDNGEYDAIILAVAGLERLGLEERINQRIPPGVLLPAVGQGIVGIECRAGDEQTKSYINALHDEDAYRCLLAERAMSRELEGGCHAPIAGFAVIEKDQVWLRGRVGAQDGSTLLQNQIRVDFDSVEDAGKQVARNLFDQGAADLLTVQQPSLSEFHGEIGDADSNDVLDLHENELNDESPAKNGIVILTRPAIFLGYLPELLERLDYSVWNLPTLRSSGIEIAPKDQTVLADISENTDIIFVSRNAVSYAVPLLQQYSAGADKARMMAVGEGSARELYDLGFDSYVPSDGVGAQALIDSIKNDVEQGSYGQRNVIIFRSPRGLNTLSTYFNSCGIQVDEVMCYEMTPPANLDQQVDEQIQEIQSKQVDIAGIFLHSADSAASLIASLHDSGRFDKLCSVELVVGSERIKQYVLSEQWQGNIRVAQTPSNKDMLIAFAK